MPGVDPQVQQLEPVAMEAGWAVGQQSKQNQVGLVQVNLRQPTSVLPAVPLCPALT